MRRGIVVAALLAFAIAAIVALAVRSTSRKHGRVAVARAEEASNGSILPPANETDTRNTVVRLDNLGNVPLRELADLLRSRSAADREKLASDLQKLHGTRATAAVTQFFKAWAEIDPTAALRAALKFSDVVMKQMALSTLFANVAPEAAGQLTRELADAPQDSLPPRSRADLLAHAIVKWSEAEPPAAAEFLTQHPEASIGIQGVPFAANQVAANWAAVDPVAAMSWARAQSDASSAVQGALGGWWEKDPEAAAAYAKQHVDSFEDQKLAGIVSSRMAVQDPQRAAEWVSQLPPEARQSAEMGVAFAWALHDPRAASNWAMALPDNERREVLGPVAGQWSMSDPQAAGQWLSSLEGPGRDEAVGTYSSAIAALDPTSALSSAATMNNGRMRDDVMRQVISNWYGRNPDAARNWLGQSNLSAEEKARLLPGPPPR